MNAKTKVIRAAREYRNATRTLSAWGNDGDDEEIKEKGKLLDAALNAMDDEVVAALGGEGS